MSLRKNGEPPAGVVLDAGPLIALVYAADPDHAISVAGFRQLAASGTRLIAPLPIVFEVYKWVLYNGGNRAAARALSTLVEALEILYPTAEAFGGLRELVAALSGWQGTLEDALVALTGLQLRAPVWTLNYRDMSAFPRLSFWTPN
jgi:predicted nucleic acid-binding protein